MKKRILALALAGTTAFSVFGAAISANAEFVWDSNTNSWVWDNDSTHTEFRNDEYVSYRDVVGVADSITVTYTAAATQKQFLDKNDGTGLAAGWQNYSTEADIINYIYDKDVKEAFSDVPLISLWGVWIHPTTGKVANFNGNTVTYDAATTTNAAAAMGASAGNIVAVGGGYTVQVTGTAQAVYKPTLEEALLEAAKQYNELHTTSPATTAYVSTNGTQVQKGAYDALTPYQTYYNNMEFRTMAGTPAVARGDVQVNNGQNAFGVNASGDRTLNWDFDASTSVSDTPISLTEVVTGTNGNSIVTTSVSTPTIFAYDYVPANQFDSTANAISGVWYDADASATDVAAAIGVNTANGVYNAERGDGSTTYSVRASVVADWVDFLDELAINHDNGYNETFDEFYANYIEIWENEPVYDPNTGLVVTNIQNFVDLYNLDALLRDIYELSARNATNIPAATGINRMGWSNANTSEMVYLMQQYDKYFDDYIQREEVATSEWGEFLLEILNAANADDFRSNTEYVRYMNRVENLEAAYEAATTVNMIREAEEGMYDLLTDLNAGFRASGSVDTNTLDATMEGLFFNVGDVPATYSAALSTPSNNVDYRTYNYFVAVSTGNIATNEWTFTTQFRPGYYSLYPMADYIQNGNRNQVYNGNARTVNAGADANYLAGSSTDEYQWFYNVYELAVNMFNDNTKQGSIDAIDAALNEAVEALAPTTTPYATETSAVEEMMDEYAGKIDTDYNEGFYNKYEQAYDYAENDAEGKYQTRIARYIVGVAGEALTYQGTQLTVTKNMINDLKDAIDSGETALEAIRNSSDYNAAQVNALNRAIDDAQYLVDLYNGDASRDEDDQSVNHVYTAKVGDKDQMVISDIDNAIEAIDAAINYSEIVMGWSKNEAGKWQYGTEEGYLSNGWNQVDGGKTWFYFNEDGTAKQSEWWNDNGTWYWFNSNCGAATGWAKVDGEWYFFKGNNAMKTGWEKVDGNWYYMASSGKMVTGWCEIGGKWYYFSKESNSLGQMLYSTTVDGYKLDANGVWVK